MRNWCRWLYSPEFNVVLFGFLLNYPWEFLQVPFYRDMPQAAHWDAILFCSRATAGDALIALVSFWGVALVSRNRRWIVQATPWQVIKFSAFAVMITIGLEWHATVVAERWAYAEQMPVIPVIGTGLLPLLQWIVLPPLIVWLVHRQIR
ncbi:hypothetical protein CK501_15000 [Halovibrio salipaludis]|uniref:Rod shape-determining protein MreD n=1 Tax=Halovibrio salipaludis TaxID=2032626 RepID=A0A2A2EV64_9GAMM|nr:MULTISPECIES: hypothetical protein [Gammaproteobacteria]KAA8981980.1 hypothetical protein F3089_09605 [Halospina sp. K52047b]PAU77026.1 hypothetical protein CK501_15000 [Halovibrio salipaludis]